MERAEKKKIEDEFRSLENEKIVLLYGEEGSGKTHILHDLCAELSKDYICIYTKYREKSSDEFIDSIIDEIRRAVPSLRLGILESVSRKSADPLNTLVSIISVISSFKKTMIIFDEMEKYSKEIIERVYYLAKSLIEYKTMIIFAYDISGMGDALRSLIVKLEEFPEDRILRIELTGFTRDETSSFIKDMGYTLPEYVIDKIQNITKGNPGKVKELLSEMKGMGLIDTDNYWIGTFENLPEIKSQKYVSRDFFSSLSEREMDFLLYASVYGYDFRADYISAILKIGNDELVELLNSLVKKNIIEEKETNIFSFTRPEYRDILYQSISNLKRRYIHRKIAQYLEDVCDCPKLIGKHYYTAGDREKAREYILEAAEIEFVDGRYKEAYELLKIYLDITPEPEERVIYIWIDTLTRLGMYNDALKYIDSVRHMVGDGISLMFREAYLDYLIGDYQKAEEILSSVRNIHQDNEISFYINFIEGGICVRRLEFEKGKEYLKKALENAQILKNDLFLATVHREIGNMNYYLGNLDIAYGHYLESLKFYERIRDYEGMSRIYNNISLIDINRDVSKALEEIQKSLVYADMSGNTYLSITIRLNLSQIYFWTGKVKEAEKEIRVGFNLSEIYGVMEIRHSIYSYLSDIYILKGNFDEAIRYLDEAIKISDRMVSPLFTKIYEMKRKEILAMMGRDLSPPDFHHDKEGIVSIYLDLYGSLVLLYQGKFAESASLMEDALKRAEGKFSFIDIVVFEGNLPFAYLNAGDKEKFLQSFTKLKNWAGSLNVDLLYLHTYLPAVAYLENKPPQLEIQEKFMLENNLKFLLLKTYISYYIVSGDKNVLEKIKNISNEIHFNEAFGVWGKQ